MIPVFDGFAALKMVRTLLPHLVLLNDRLPGMDGLECLDLLRASKGMQQTSVILMSAAPPQSVQARTDLILLEKPFEMESLLTLIRHLLAFELMRFFLFPPLIYKISMEGVTRLAETASIRGMANREQYLITDLLVEGAIPSLACRRQKAASPW